MTRTSWFIFVWVMIGLVYEAVTLLDDVKNNTISHVITDAYLKSPWLVGGGFCFIVIMLLGHWFLRTFIWAPAKWEDDPTTPEDESLRN